MNALPEITYPPHLERRIARRALACARRLRWMRRERLCEPDVPVRVELRRDSAGTLTNVRFRVGFHPDAVELDATKCESLLADALEWHARERCAFALIRHEWGDEPLLGASDEEVAAIADVLSIDPVESAWTVLAEAEQAARRNESNHRRMLRHAARRLG